MTEQRHSPEDDHKPVPDPTVLTTQALLREIAALKELVLARLDGLDRLFEEKFETLEASRLEQKKDTQDAINAALTAQKDAVTKSEAAVGKQLEDQQKASNTAINDLRRSIDDLKERIGEVAQTVNGSVQQRIGARDDRTALYATIGILVTVLLAAIAVVGVIVGTRSV
jgi:tetrahydromethanopterin S-methyltransferase subunit G